MKLAPADAGRSPSAVTPLWRLSPSGGPTKQNAFTPFGYGDFPDVLNREQGSSVVRCGLPGGGVRGRVRCGFLAGVQITIVRQESRAAGDQKRLLA